jgi:hypothetical protein
MFWTNSLVALMLLLSDDVLVLELRRDVGGDILIFSWRVSALNIR